MGAQCSDFRIPNRVFKVSSVRGPDEIDSSSSRSREKTRSRRGNPWPCLQESCLPSPCVSVSQSDPINVLPSSKKARSLEAHPEPQTSEQGVHHNKEVPYGNPRLHNSYSVSRHVGRLHRLKGCLPTHPDQQGLSQIPGFPLSRDRLLLPGSSLWSGHSSSSFHPGDEGSRCSPQEEQYPSVCLSGRLADPRSFQGTSNPRFSDGHSMLARPRLDHQLGEVGTSSRSSHHLSRGSPGFPIRSGFSNKRKGVHSCFNPERHLTPKGSSSKDLASPSGTHGVLSGDPSNVSPQDETDPVSRSSTLQSRQRPVNPEDSSHGRVTSVPSVVVSPGESTRGSSFFSSQASCHDHHRCLKFRLGSGLEIKFSGRPVERLREALSHKRSGTHSRVQGNKDLGTPTSGTRSNDSLRQLHDRLVHKQTRGYQVSQPLHSNVGVTQLLSGTEHIVEGQSSGREAQRSRRRPLQREARRERMGVIADLGGSRLPTVSPSLRGPICHSRQLETSQLLLQIPSSSGLGDRCSLVRLEQPLVLRLPSVPSGANDSAEIPSVSRRDDPDSPMLAKSTVVSSPLRPTDRSAVPVSNDPELTHAEEGSAQPPQPGISQIDCVEVVHRRVQEKGLSSKAAELATLARRPTTSKTYNSRLAKFSEWSEAQSVSPLDASLEEVCAFFVHLFDSGRQVSTIRNYRSAISAVHNGFQDGSSIGSNPVISDLLKGMFNKRPPARRLAPSWSINDVLQSLTVPPFEPLHRAPLDALTLKTVFLIAAASARRRSEIHALSIKPGFTRFSPAGVHLLPDPAFLSKNQSILFTPDPIFLPDMSEGSSIREDKLVCPVRALKWYIDKTKHLRTSEALFILPRAPYSPASKDTISRWIVSLIAKHAKPGESIRAHDVRAHASSTAWFRGVPLLDIMKAAAWKTPSSFVSTYLTNVISAEGVFATSVLRGSSSQVRNLPPTSRC